MGSFQQAILGYSLKAQNSGSQAARQLARLTLRATVEETPVRTGRLKGNWRVGLGAPDTKFRENLKDKVGNYTVARGLAIINRAKWDQRIFVTNTTPYGRWVNYGTVHITPRLFMERAINRVKKEYPQLLAQIRRKNG